MEEQPNKRRSSLSILALTVMLVVGPVFSVILALTIIVAVVLLNVTCNEELARAITDHVFAP